MELKARWRLFESEKPAIVLASYFSGRRALAILFRFTRIQVKSRTLTLQDKRQSDNPT